MRYVIICQNEFMIDFMQRVLSRKDYLLYIVSKKKLQTKLAKAGFDSILGDIENVETYRAASLSEDDSIITHVGNRKTFRGILKAISQINDNLPVLALSRTDTRIKNLPLSMVDFISFPDLFKKTCQVELDKLLTQKRVKGFLSLFKDCANVLILLQHDPDPDAIACALALRTLLGRNKLTAPMATFGGVTRPENLAMLKSLGIRIERMDRSQLEDYDAIALVDVQPAYFDPPIENVDLVVDHHPEQKGYKAKYRDIRTTYGATATIFTEYLRAMDMKVTQKLATALLYAIKSDTLFLDKEVSQADVEAFAYLYALANINTLRRIEHPELPLATLNSFGQALKDAVIKKKVLFSHLGEVAREDVIPQLADFCLQIEEIEWSVVSGTFDDNLVISVRNVGYVKAAGEIMKTAFGDIGSAGGHRTMAKAVIPLEKLKETGESVSQNNLKDLVIKKFLGGLKGG